MKPTKRQSIIGRRSSVRIHSGPNVSHGHTSGFNHNWRPALLLRQLGGPFGRRDSWKYLKQSLQTYFYIYIWHTYTLYIINYSTYGKREREMEMKRMNTCTVSKLQDNPYNGRILVFTCLRLSTVFLGEGLLALFVVVCPGSSKSFHHPMTPNTKSQVLYMFVKPSLLMTGIINILLWV